MSKELNKQKYPSDIKSATPTIDIKSTTADIVPKTPSDKSTNTPSLIPMVGSEVKLFAVPKAKHGVVIHCSDSPQGRGDDATNIDSWHKQRGWSGIGYHYVITEDGTIQNGRKRSKTGAHAKGYNHYVGICLIGRDSFTEVQYIALAKLLNSLNAPRVIGHYAISSKTCPNFDVEEYLQTEIFKEYGLPHSLDVLENKTLDTAPKVMPKPKLDEPPPDLCGAILDKDDVAESRANYLSNLNRGISWFWGR